MSAVEFDQNGITVHGVTADELAAAYADWTARLDRFGGELARLGFGVERDGLAVKVTAPAAPRPLVIIGCGRGKLDRPARAAELYTGGYFHGCLLTACAIADPADVLVLSAKHGLLALGDVVDPYDLTIGQPGAIDALQLQVQAANRGLLDRRVLALCSKRYADLIERVWVNVDKPLAGLGIGKQRHVLAELRSAGELLAELGR